MNPLKSMLLTILAVSLVLPLAACSTVDESVGRAEQKRDRDGVFIHIESGPDEPHTVLMALQMARIMAEDRPVLVYCDIEGVHLVLKNRPSIQHAAFPDSHTQIAKLKELGASIQACPGCLKAAGKSADDLMEGVDVANKEAFFEFTKGRILTLDY